jgi:hypothetical protein
VPNDARKKLHEDKILELLGARLVAIHLGLPRATVQSWRTRGVPERWRSRVREIAAGHAECLAKLAGS